MLTVIYVNTQAATGHVCKIKLKLKYLSCLDCDRSTAVYPIVMHRGGTSESIFYVIEGKQISFGDMMSTGKYSPGPCRGVSTMLSSGGEAAVAGRV